MSSKVDFVGVLCPICKKPQPYFLRLKKSSRKVQCPSCGAFFDASKYLIPKEYILQAWKLPSEQRQMLMSKLSTSSKIMLNGGSIEVNDDEGIEVRESSERKESKVEEVKEEKIDLSASSLSEPKSSTVTYDVSDRKVEEVKPIQVNNQGTIETPTYSPNTQGSEQITQTPSTPLNQVPNQVNTQTSFGMNEISSRHSSIQTQSTPSTPPMYPPNMPPDAMYGPSTYPPMSTQAPPYMSYVPPRFPPIQHPPEPLRRKTSAEILLQVLEAYGVDEETKRWLVNMAHQFDEQGQLLDPITLEGLLFIWTNGGRRRLNQAAIWAIVNHYAREYYKELFKDEAFIPMASMFASQYAYNPVIAGMMSAMRDFIQYVKQELENVKSMVQNRSNGMYPPTMPPELYTLLSELRNAIERLNQVVQSGGSGGNVKSDEIKKTLDEVSTIYKTVLEAYKSAFESIKTMVGPPWGYSRDDYKFLDRLVSMVERKNIVDKIAHAFGTVVAYAKLAEKGKIPPEVLKKGFEHSKVLEVGVSEGKVSDVFVSKKEEELASSSKVFYEKPPSEYIKGEKAKSSKVAKLVEELGGEVEELSEEKE